MSYLVLLTHIADNDVARVSRCDCLGPGVASFVFVCCLRFAAALTMFETELPPLVADWWDKEKKRDNPDAVASRPAKRKKSADVGSLQGPSAAPAKRRAQKKQSPA